MKGLQKGDALTLMTLFLRCYARATTMGIHVLAWSGEHNHEVIEHQLQCYDRKYANAYPANDPRSKKIWERPDKI